MRAALFSTLLFVGLAGCSSETAPTAQPEAKPQAAQPQPAPQPAPQAVAQKLFGAPITETKTTALTELFKEPT
ncbi:MAG TPA: hypothetical protein VLS89_02080, partial [Candidatus Nanopelagicales bacterium]|nr:hypothetical protein [Candidatus Nanopelagicales bacterium]